MASEQIVIAVDQKDGEHFECAASLWISENGEDDECAAAFEQMQNGETVMIGGGATPLWRCWIETRKNAE